MISLDARLTGLSSLDLLTALERTAAQGREVTADLIALLAECEARQLYAAEGYASLFEFCVKRLRLSEAQSYHRIQAARAVRRFPLIMERLREGRVTLTVVALLREHLTEANHREVLDWADGRGKREVELFVRRLDPKPEVPLSIRRLSPTRARSLVVTATEHQAPGGALGVASTARSGGVPNDAVSLRLLFSPPAVVLPAAPMSCAESISERPDACPTPARNATSMSGRDVCAPTIVGRPPVRRPNPRSEIRPLAPARYSLHVTISQETYDKLRRAQDLLRHALPSADAALVLDRALTLLVAQLERRKVGAPAMPGRVTATRCRSKTPRRRRQRQQIAAGSAEPPPNGTKPEPSAPPLGPRAPDMRSARARSRYIPAAIRRAVWDREGGRCGYVAPSGMRCSATARLEYHHLVPFADGGPSTADNLVLRCTRHNALAASGWFNFDRAEFGVRPPQNPGG